MKEHHSEPSNLVDPINHRYSTSDALELGEQHGKVDSITDTIFPGAPVVAVATVEAEEKVKVVYRPKGQQSTHTKSGFESVHYNLSVVTPTRNERNNVVPLLQMLKSALDGISVEVLFIDDSDDDTPDVVKEAAHRLGCTDFHIRLEHRCKGPDRAGGLATAVDRGLRLAEAKYVAVIDADLQHPPEQLRVFYDQAVKQNVDLVLASRYIKGGGNDGLDGVSRLLFSVGLKWTAKMLFPEHLEGVSDPLGGFFLLKRSLLDNVTLHPIGYKILLEILIRCQWQSLVEVPYRFQQRKHGQSKADVRQGIMVLRHMGRLFREVPAAGRIWKCMGLALLNLLCACIILFLANALPGIGQPLSMIVFAVLVCFNLVLMNRCIFPAIPVAQREPDLSVQVPPFELTDISEIVHSPKKKLFKGRVLTCIALLVTVIAIGWISVTLPGAWILIGGLFVGFSVMAHKRVATHKMVTMVLGMLVGVATFDYLGWRFAVTNWAGWWIAIPLLMAETLGAIHTLGFQYTLWPWRQLRLRITVDPTRYPIFVFIPTVNEGAAILEPTLRGVLVARDRYLEEYPHGQVTIVICNDGYVAKAPCWQEMEDLARRLGVMCITRTEAGGAKAGNIEHARQRLNATGNALLVIFDADQIAKPDFFLATIPPFGDPSLGWVQTGQYYRNLENPVARWADDQQSMFYNLLCPGKASLNAAFICGTNVVIRAKALDQIGGLPQDSVTEDFSASIALHAKWRSVFLTEVLATGMGPLDMPSYLKQQRRWAIGTLGILRTNWRDLFLPKKNGLSCAQRLQYFLACTHYLCGLRNLIYFVCPILFIFTGISSMHGSTFDAFLWYFLPYWLVSMASFWYAGRGITGLRGIIIGFGSFPVLIDSLLAVVLRRKVGFTITSKQRSGKQSFSHLWVYVLFLLVGIVCIGKAAFSNEQEKATFLISDIWILYSMVMLGSFLWLSLKDLRFQRATHHEVVIAGQQVYPSRLKERETSLRPVGNLVFAALLACVVITGSNVRIASNASSSPFVISSMRTASPLIGLSLPIQLLQTRPSVLEAKLNTPFSIVGRTQEVHDMFDQSWVNQLAVHNEYPWITLEFGTFGAHGKPPLDASLPAIANGLHDDDLKRWADSIRDNGKPVYLTILPDVDVKWSLSSAVANGGVPQDVPRAWSHVQSIFKAEGANNVAWVWAPADPAHDSMYAPVPSTIDAVLLSMISYPNTQWTDPEKVVQAVIARYPTRPIMVEVSAAGNQAQKALWLTSVGHAVSVLPNIHALIYHEGSPSINRTSTENASWSILSDPSSERAWRQVVTNLMQEKPLPYTQPIAHQ